MSKTHTCEISMCLVTRACLPEPVALVLHFWHNSPMHLACGLVQNLCVPCDTQLRSDFIRGSSPSRHSQSSSTSVAARRQVHRGPLPVKHRSTLVQASVRMSGEGRLGLSDMCANQYSACMHDTACVLMRMAALSVTLPQHWHTIGPLHYGLVAFQLLVLVKIAYTIPHYSTNFDQWLLQQRGQPTVQPRASQWRALWWHCSCHSSLTLYRLMMLHLSNTWTYEQFVACLHVLRVCYSEDAPCLPIPQHCRASLQHLWAGGIRNVVVNG